LTFASLFRQWWSHSCPSKPHVRKPDDSERRMSGLTSLPFDSSTFILF